MDLIEIEKQFKQVLESIGFNTEKPGREKTPKRVLKALMDQMKKEEFNWTEFNGNGTSEMIIERNIHYSSSCEHHLYPFYGKAFVAYIPKDKIIGLSKLPRIVKYCSRDFQTQEYLTNTIAESIMEKLKPWGVAVVLVAEHTCVSCRGAEAYGADTVTSKMLGSFKDQMETRQEFLNLLKL